MIELSQEGKSIEPLLNKALTNLTCLDKLYEKSDNKGKREIIGSIFPEKLVFDGFQYRNARMNEAVQLIYSMDKGFSQNENGQTEPIFDLSTLVPGTRFELARSLEHHHLKVACLPISTPGLLMKIN